MNYITSQEAADKWGLTRRSVQIYCREGKIPGAVNPGKQWLIPENAEKPPDSRLEKNKYARNSEPYHFPIFVYTNYYFSASELSEDERLLREAQLLNLKCEFSESVTYCRKLIDESPSVSVRFGAWFTNYSNYMFLGLTSQLPGCIENMISISESAVSHQEDYRLLLAFLDHTYRFDKKRYLEIDVAELSTDAITTYKLISLAVAYFSVDDVPKNTINFFEAVCKETDTIGIAPAGVTMHGLLAMLHSRNNNMEAKLHHIDEAGRIGHENGVIRLLAKCSALDIDTFHQRLCKYGKRFANDIRNRCIRNRKNWQLAYAIHTGSNPAINVRIFETEIVLLLIYKMSIEDIAILKNITAQEVRDTIKALCKKLSVKSKKELVVLFMNTYGFTPDT